MPTTVFFSWASDPGPAVGRNFIERTLERALGSVARDAELALAVREEIALDRDTRNEPGQPPITETIFFKIDNAAVYVCDLTLVATRINDKGMSPNPNVLIEYGWALKSRGYGRIVAVMNTAYGEPNETNMPFNMRHLRQPICYCLPEDADEATRQRVRSELQRDLERAIKLVLKTHGVPEPAVEAFPTIEPDAAKSRWTTFEGSLGIRDSRPGQPAGDLFMPWRPEIWFRLLPTSGADRGISVSKILATADAVQLLPPIVLQYGGSMTRSFRERRGAGVYLITPDKPQITESAVAIFTTGELWAVDSAILAAEEAHNAIPFVEEIFRKALKRYMDALAALDVAPPLRWIAGIRGIRGRSLVYPTRPNAAHLSMGGVCADDWVYAEGIIDHVPVPPNVLSPFFAKLFDLCGTSRPAHLDEQVRFRD